MFVYAISTIFAEINFAEIKIIIPYMKKANFLFVDFSLIVLFVLLVYTGVTLHVVSSGPHSVWHNWAVAHIVSGALFLIFAIVHIKQHWGWYKQLVKRVGNKSRVTILLSLHFLFETVSGILLVSVVEGGGSTIGHWHFVAGLAMGAVGLWHIAARVKVLVKWMK